MSTSMSSAATTRCLAFSCSSGADSTWPVALLIVTTSLASRGRIGLGGPHRVEALELPGDVEGRPRGGGEVDRARQRQRAALAVAGGEALQHQAVAVADEVEADAGEDGAEGEALIAAVAQRELARSGRGRDRTAHRGGDGERPGQAVLAERQPVDDVGELAVALDMEGDRAARRQGRRQALRVEHERPRA